MAGHTVAMIDGHRWYWWRARLCDEYSLDGNPQTMRWFLRDDNDFVDDFATRREVEEYIKTEGPVWIAAFAEGE